MKKFLSFHPLFAVILTSAALALTSCAISFEKSKSSLPPKAENEIGVMSFNVENLFDTTHDADREDYTYMPVDVKKASPEIQKACVDGNTDGKRRGECLNNDWNDEKLDKKLRNLTSVVLGVDGKGPDVLMLIEVENENVLQIWNKGYLQKAGYKDGKSLPEIPLELNSDGERNVNVMQEVKKQLKDNLNLDVTLNVVTTAQLSENMTNGKADFFRVGWGADYPSPESFLWYLYGKNVPSDTSKSSYPNMSRYKNPKFDELYEKGLAALDKKEQYAYFLKAEKVAMADAPIIVLFYDEGYRLIQNKVKNFPNNAMQYRDFSNVYFVPQPAAKE